MRHKFFIVYEKAMLSMSSFSKNISLFLLCLILMITIKAQVTYPYPVQQITIQAEGKTMQMVFMDIKPLHANGKAVMLFHGKNFNGYYWKDVAASLVQKGYRVVIPDQVGWGKSDKPNIHYSFHLLARNNSILLDSLHLQKVSVIGHSTGGMLAIRFVLMYPLRTEKLILENPVGLEDYRTFVPYQPTEKLWDKEKNTTYASYKKYMQTYFPEWKPEYEQYVQAQAESLTKPDFEETAFANALTYQMIYEQPVVYELKNISISTLLIIGQADRTIVGREYVTEEQKKNHGLYPQLGVMAHAAIKNSVLFPLAGVGHIAHLQVPQVFNKAVIDFLEN